MADEPYGSPDDDGLELERIADCELRSVRTAYLTTSDFPDSPAGLPAAAHWMQFDPRAAAAQTSQNDQHAETKAANPQGPAYLGPAHQTSPQPNPHQHSQSLQPTNPPTTTAPIPTSLNNGRASSTSSHSSPEPASTNARKRKSSESDEGDDDAPSGKKGGGPPKKTAHNMIEKRYRTNLNDKIAALRDSVPSLRVMSRPNGTEEDDDPEDLEGLTPAHKLNKATVLSKATEYIRHLEKRNKRLQEELTTLKGRIDSYEKMSITGPMSLHGNLGTPDGSRYPEDPFAAQHGVPMSGPPQGMIPVPENIAALQRGLPPQQHYASAYSPGYGSRQAPGPPMVNARRSGAMVGKLMVGSLAGLMILEGLVEREQSQEAPAGRGLFALPINLVSVLAPRMSIGVASAQIPLAKTLLIFGAFLYIILPWLDLQSKPKKKSQPAVLLAPAPSLASPVEVRRKAWLTAIQTVWVPRHNFILEVAALGLKTLKLSMRRIIGWEGYAHLTGITKEQEEARVKAWEIALDAQLAGGDAEISKSRLLLTLIASGTLPDTPARLMLKALHIRIVLWDIENTGHGLWWLLESLSAKLARSYWNVARSEHRIAVNTLKQNSEAAPLPEHLAALIERECDEVLVPAVIQRAYNLAWNKPSAEQTTVDTSMDAVVEDFAICSPLDALAAWYSSHTLNKGLASTLATLNSSCKKDAIAMKNSSPEEDAIYNLDLALRVAPPNSQAHLRALVAHAVVLDDERDSHIASALKALPSSPKPADAGFINLVGNGFVAVDVRKALTLAKCLSLIASDTPEARRRAIFVINNTHLPEVTTTLLSFVAAQKVLTHFMTDSVLKTETICGLRRVGASLRMWIGHATGRRIGLTKITMNRVVNSLVDANKILTGMADKKKEEGDVDDGYVSASVKDD
ncbi:sterol regulatory element binding sre1 [Pyrenophora seminiperda CCB06]|uniref:Sterol regulatory element binding sre1 n=1 Tax=Pyrenophora seminiperda CCB06 TaxID=1302712 RepID=A0A3M7M7K1_9PLEO|nr:sterol regulatory element binding sre1 [Pyrenophora seminiperda CCB06]